MRLLHCHGDHMGEPAYAEADVVRQHAGFLLSAGQESGMLLALCIAETVFWRVEMVVAVTEMVV